MKKAVLPLGLSALLFTAYHLSSSKKVVPADAIPPNIIFFLIDDLGMISTPPYTNGTADGMVWLQNDTTRQPIQPGISYTTPHIYDFSTDAMVLTNMYSTPSCAPSRAQLMSGLYPFETGITWPAFDTSTYLRKPTFLNILNQPTGGNYYAGFGGKWNLKYGIYDYDAINSGYDNMPYSELVYNQMQHLQSCGFDTTFGPAQEAEKGVFTGGAALIGNTVDYYPNEKNGPFFPDTLHAWAKNFVKQGIENRKTNNQPFYLQYCLGLIHDEYRAPHNEAFGPNYKLPDGKFRDKYIPKQLNWADKMEYADSLIGEILTDLINTDSNVYNNTVIIIAGDNGTESQYYSNYQNHIVEGGKITYNTWGSQVPFMIRWPNHIATGTYDGLTDFSDIFNTIVEGIVQTDNPIATHGHSFFDQIKINAEAAKKPRRAVYSQMRSGAFVANENYQYRVNTDDQYGASESGLYSTAIDSTSNPFIYSNGSLANHIKQDSLNNPSLEWQNFDTLYSYLCYLQPTDYDYDPLNICDSTAINTLVTDYWPTAGD